MEESTSLIKESLIERQFKDQEYSSQHKMFNTEREICYQAWTWAHSSQRKEVRNQLQSYRHTTTTSIQWPSIRIQMDS